MLAHFFQDNEYSFAESDRVKAFVRGQASNLPPPPQPNPPISTCHWSVACDRIGRSRVRDSECEADSAAWLCCRQWQDAPDHPRKVPGKMVAPYAEAVKLAEEADEFSSVSCISRQQQCELQYNRQCWQQALAIALNWRLRGRQEAEAVCL